MSVFAKLVSAAIADGSVSSVIRDCRGDYILPEERPLYDFIRNHVQRYGQLPNPQTVQQAGHVLPSAEERTPYYVDRIKARFTYNVINERHAGLRQAMQSTNMEEAVRVLRDMLTTVGGTMDDASTTTFISEVDGVVEEYEQRKWATGLAGITFGWPTLDNLTLGAMGGDLIVLAGRPSMGKSWLLFESAFQAWSSGHSSLIVSMEMGKRQIVRRFIGRHLGINPNFLRQGQISGWAETMLHNYGEHIAGRPRITLLSGDMNKTVDVIESAVAEHLPDIIYVDAAYLLSPAGRQLGPIQKWESISKVISELKQIAIRYDRPIFITVQFKRSQKTNSTKELDLGDIAGSDSIPQDASIVLGIKKGDPPFEAIRRKVFVMKNREGDTGDFTVDFTFTPPSMLEVTEGSATEELSGMGWV